MAGCSLVFLTSLNRKILFQYFWTLKLGSFCSGLNFVGTKKQAEQMSNDSQNSVIAKLRKLSRFNKQSTLIIVASRADYFLKIGELNFLYLPSPKNDWDRLPSLLRGWVRNHLKPRELPSHIRPSVRGAVQSQEEQRWCKKEAQWWGDESGLQDIWQAKKGSYNERGYPASAQCARAGCIKRGN